MIEPVVISGMGTIGSCGVGVGPLRTALRTGTPVTSEVSRSSEHRPGGAVRAALVGPVDLSAWVKPAAARRMSAVMSVVPLSEPVMATMPWPVAGKINM